MKKFLLLLSTIVVATSVYADEFIEIIKGLVDKLRNLSNTTYQEIVKATKHIRKRFTFNLRKSRTDQLFKYFSGKITFAFEFSGISTFKMKAESLISHSEEIAPFIELYEHFTQFMSPTVLGAIVMSV